MLDMGFINDIKKIDKYLPKKKQNLMFTATFSDPFRSLVKQFSNDPIEISVAKDNETGKNIEHYCHQYFHLLQLKVYLKCITL